MPSKLMFTTLLAAHRVYAETGLCNDIALKNIYESKVVCTLTQGKLDCAVQKLLLQFIAEIICFKALYAHLLFMDAPSSVPLPFFCNAPWLCCFCVQNYLPES